MVLSQAITNGLSVASILIIISLGLAIIFGVMNVINLAHGELIMTGSYVTYVIYTINGLPFFVAVIIACLTSAILGVLIESSVIKQLYGRPLDTLLASYGISIMLQQIAKLIFGSGGKSVATPVPGSFTISTIVIPYYRLSIIFFSILLLLLVLFIIFKTTLGIQIRTTSQNRQISESLGINTSRIDTLTFAIGSGLAGIAGAILAPLQSVSPTMGLSHVIDAFMAIVLGGVGSLIGTAFGSLIIGEGNQILTIFTSETSAKLLIFTIIIIIIRFKPQGIFKMESR